jgi:hypothetical protein
MKVSKTGGAKGPDSTRKKSKSSEGGAGFADALKTASGSPEMEAAQATSSVGHVDAILAVQQTADATDHKSRGLMMDYGNEMLDRLEQLRISILNGAISKDRLQDMARRLRERTSNSDDPRLNELIDDIELRVEVEIAKLRR